MSVHVLAGDHIVSSDTIPQLRSTLPYLGNGVTRSVYDLGNGSVLKSGKADSCYGGNLTEARTWEMLRDSEVGQYLAEVIAYDTEDGAWLIMRKVDGTIGDACSSVRDAYYSSDAYYVLSSSCIGDLHEGNIGYVVNCEEEEDYSFYAIDYAMSGDGSYSSSTCEGCSNRWCDDHSFRRQDACCTIGQKMTRDCEFPMGCAEECCDNPNCDKRAMIAGGQVYQLETVRWYNAWNVDHVWLEEEMYYCANCAPRSVHDADFAREMAGQLAMFGRYISRQF